MRKAHNLTGQKFGKLLVKHRVESDNKGARWLCICECGNKKVVSASKLRHKTSPTKSCGCLRSKFIDVTGQRFGKLVAQSFTWKYYDNGSHKKAIWHCKCDCGGESFCSVSNLQKGNSTSCGCSRILPNALAPKRSLLRKYKTGATNRGFEFTLSEDRFYQLISQNCFYCGIEPSSKMHHRIQKSNPDFRYNGIDRLNNNKGYSDDNVVSCCWDCNLSKGSRSRKDFTKWLDRIVSFRS